jgi:hypothetical protein
VLNQKEEGTIMKTIELTPDAPSLHDLLELADRQNIIIKTPEGKQFVLAELDDFEPEVEQLKTSKDFMAFLDQRSKQRGTTSMEELRNALASTEAMKPRQISCHS